ncbi:MAG: hypothetical protein RI556_01575 [Hydrogenovibrio sp.]|uniref:hypothetical protein n=1 Tax=Hydrogenovibrio TaxID=28884 RepID=UPI0012FD95DA|nr:MULTISPECIES: hypothetical protein [Hydrogenovibrio]MDR9497838.1 hypothetical protein [Hydrogenovibrio sp.]
MKKQTCVWAALIVLNGLFWMPGAYAGDTSEEAKEDAKSAWEKTKETAKGVGQDVKEAWGEAKSTSWEEIESSAEKQGTDPVKPEEDEAGIPVE